MIYWCHAKLTIDRILHQALHPDGNYSLALTRNANLDTQSSDVSAEEIRESDRSFQSMIGCKQIKIFQGFSDQRGYSKNPKRKFYFHCLCTFEYLKFPFNIGSQMRSIVSETAVWPNPFLLHQENKSMKSIPPFKPHVSMW